MPDIKTGALIRMLLDTVVETVQAAGTEGAPEGPMYAAFMTYGISLDTFRTITDALVEAGKIRRSGHILYEVKP